MFKYVGILFYIMSSLQVLACDLSMFEDDFKGEMIVPYCTDKELCKGKKELYAKDFICALSDFYKLDIIYNAGVRAPEMADEVGRSFIGWGYYGGGVEGFVYCEFNNGKCNFKREFYCENRIWKKDNNVDFCRIYSYYIDGVEVGINDELVEKDEVFRFLMENLPKQRRTIKYFEEMEMAWD